MAAKQYGKVYLYGEYAGLLEERPGNAYVFTYDETYVSENKPAISHTLPVRLEPHVSYNGLHSYFDNLVAEGWLRDAQSRALSVSKENRFALLLAFGADCIGAVTIVDPEPRQIEQLDLDNPEMVMALASRASLSGVQPKIAAIKTSKGYQAAGAGETSTHIAKLPSNQHKNILELEYLTLKASGVLFPGDTVAEAEITNIGEAIPYALLVKRFDRTPEGGKKHFEEFNQLLNKASGDEKYEGAYEDMGQFILETPGCIPAEADKLYRRILAAVLTGNTDAHFKNFAMFHTPAGLRLTPSYDLVAAEYYKDYQTFALSLAGGKNMIVSNIKPKHIIELGENFKLPHPAIKLAVDDIGKRIEKAKETVFETKEISNNLKDALIKLMEKRWSGTFSLIGQQLSKKPSSGAKLKNLLSND